MATTTSKTINVELAYTDHSERTYKIPYNRDETSSEWEDMKDKIRAFNTAAANESGAVANTFLSKEGAKVAGVKSATLITTTEDVIYSG